MTVTERIHQLLAQDNRFVANDQLLKNRVLEAAFQLDEKLLQSLWSDEWTRERFFKSVGAIQIFNQRRFQQFINHQSFLSNSYTAFKNKIGLSDGQQYLKERKEVHLAWAYKDAVLEGGQQKEEQKRGERFWNTTLAADEIDRLLSPKVWTNTKRFDHQKLEETATFHADDHLLLKGNNLVALHSLQARFRGQVKLIYIDPPYNTGGDGFNYNDSFNHSAWLTFMKNRLEVARTLLRSDGIIYISCDDRENAYLKVLCDEIFGREQFITQLIWRKKAGGANDSQDIAVEHEYIIAYRKQENGIYKMPLDEKTASSYKYKDDKLETHGGYKTKDLNDASLSDSPGLHYDIESPDGSVLRGDAHQWKCNEATFQKRLADDRIVFKKMKDGWRVHYKIYLNEQKGELRYDAQGNIIPRGRNLSSILYTTALNKDGSNDLKRLFGGSKPFAYPKPVKLLETLILSATGQDDLILDFFAGSGTTGEAVIKLNAETGSRRRFILVEQMDYIEAITLQRMQKALAYYENEETVTYAELKEAVPQLLQRIQEASNHEMLFSLYEQIQATFLLDYAVQSFSLEELEELFLEEAKHLLLELIDQNNWYVPFSEVRNGDFECTESEVSFSAAFYGRG
jgi:adenine-specific DNA-methyltransferase